MVNDDAQWDDGIDFDDTENNNKNYSKTNSQ